MLRGLLVAGALALKAVSGWTGEAQWIDVADEFGNHYQSVAANASSGRLRVMLMDDFGSPASTTTNVSSEIRVWDEATWTQVPFLISFNDGMSFSTVSAVDFATVTVNANNPASPPFKIRLSAAGQYSVEAKVNDLLGLGERWSYMTLDVLPSGAGFTGVSLRTDSQPAATAGQTTVQITPNRDGVNDAAVIRASPPGGGFWEAVFSPVDFATSASSAYSQVVTRYFLYGTNEFFWYGNDFEGRTVPNGSYYVRLQTNGGGIVHDVLRVDVVSAFIKGRVVTAGPTPVQDVDVNVWGPGGGGFARTGADGRFFVGGLSAGQRYTVNFSKPGLAGTQQQNVEANSDIGDVTLNQGAQLWINLTVGQAPDHDLWGNAFANTSNYSHSAWGGLHVASGSSTSDNGFPPADAFAYSTWTKLALLPNTQYRVTAELAEFGRVEITTTTGAGGTTYYWLPSIPKKANVSGQISVPSAVATPYGGEWVSVDAMPAGGQSPVAWGGAFINNGQTAGTYRVNGLSPGTYTLRTFSRGYVPSSQSVTVVGTSDVNNVDFTLGTGGQISGSITIIGDSSAVDAENFFSSCPPGQVPLHVNAWSPSNYQSSFAEVCFSTTTNPNPAPVAFTMKGLADGTYEMYTFLPGFQLDPPGPKRATVSNGSGGINFTFRRLSGAVALSASYPSGDNPASISYQVQSRGFFEGGSQPPSGNLDGNGQALIQGLGSGLYEITLRNNNPNRGLRKTVGVAVTNGNTAAVSVDMSEATYSISGTISVQGNIVLPSTWSVTVSSPAGLRAASPTAPLVQVFPLGRRGGGSSQPLAQVPAVPSGSGASFNIPGFPPGGYLVRVKSDLNPQMGNCGPDGCNEPPGMPEFASSAHAVFVENASPAPTAITLQNGVRVSGTISRPAGDTDVSPREFELLLFGNDGMTVWRTTMSLTGASGSYAFGHIGAGEYFLEVRDQGTPGKYAASPKSIKVGASDETSNIQLLLAGSVVGRMRDAGSNTLLTAQNATQFIPDSFGIFAHANPWVPGGFSEADRNMTGPGPQLNSQGQFTIPRLIPDTNYDVTLKGFSLDPKSVARGQKAYAPAVKSGVRVAAGQTVDIGTIDLTQGVSLSGSVTDTREVALPNILIAAVPALLDGDDARDFAVETFTDGAGNYVLQGVDPEQRYYDVIAAPRFDGGDVMSQLGGAKYGEETVQMVDVTDPEARLGVDFELTEANATLTGRIVTEDGGPLSIPFGENQGGFADRQGMVFLHQEGVVFDDNPLGEIEEPTDASGNFTIRALKPGTYTLRAVSVGYATAKKTLVISAGANNAGTVTLARGATVSGTITKPDGSNPSTEEVDFIVGVDEDFEEFVFGTPQVSGDSLVTGYSLTGFKTGIDYSIIIITGNDDMLQARSGLTFSSASEEKTVNLVYRPAPPSVYATQTRVGDRFTLRFFSTHKLRNLTDADNDMDQMVTLTQGNGTVISKTLSGSRDLITVVYDRAANEKTFKFKLEFDSIQQDLDDPEGDNFHFEQEFKFFAGARRMRVIRIPNAIGGNLKMEGVPTACGFVSGTFGGSGIGSSSSVEVGIVSAEDLTDFTDSPPSPCLRACCVSAAAQKLGPEAYPSAAMYAAMQAAPAVSPFSPFYEVFLPAGVNRSFKKDALITLTYDATVTDPSGINVYYFDPNNNVFLLEAHKRKIDAKNKTITVAVNHASTFVVLNNNAPIVGANTYAGTEIALHNFPNPFDLKPKTVSLSNAPSSPTQTIDGTMIRYALPAGKSGEVKFDIYNVAGELVRTISESAPNGATYYYTQWDGKNDAGKKVASGVYIGRFTLNDGDERFIKMAVVK
jgi:flagellar hook assembly protein FlgD